MPDRILRSNGSKSIIRFGRDLKDNWERTNPILQEGEKVISFFNVEKTDVRIKIGDGVTPFNNLRWRQPYLLDSLGTDKCGAPTQRAITEGIKRVENLVDVFSYQTKI